MKCPLADYLKKWNIECPLPLKQDKETCRHCEYWREGKCQYNQIMAEKEKGIMRGFGALTKQTALKLKGTGRIDEETAKEIERAGVKLSALKDKEEQREYWEISRAYDEEWEKASPEKRAELEWQRAQLEQEKSRLREEAKRLELARLRLRTEQEWLERVFKKSNPEGK